MTQSLRDVGSRAVPWPRNTAAHRWYGFGRYYAMFPPSFAYNAVKGLTRCGETVLDPFCGRGNGPFTATVLKRPALGIDLNPVAWLFTAVKLQPEANPDRLIKRLREIANSSRRQDRRGHSRFERMAWSPKVRAFLKSARRELDWKESVTDRTLMAFVALHMQDKIGAGLSNVLWPTIACSPRYAVTWWTTNGFDRPPDVDPVDLLEDKISRRYLYGIPKQATGSAFLCDARDALQSHDTLNAGLLITSPPYNGVTDYWNDHWIRLWILGNKMKKDWKRSAKHENSDNYKELILGVFSHARRHLKGDAAILVRSDLRRQTARTCLKILRKLWPQRTLLYRTSAAPHNGISICHGRGGSKSKEVDFLIPGKLGHSWGQSNGFEEFEGQGDIDFNGEKST